MRDRLVFGVAVLSTVCATSASGSAAAQIAAADDTGFSVERYTPPAGHTPFLSMDHADVLPHFAFSTGFSVSLMSKPIVLRDVFDRELVTTPVASRLGLELAGAIGLGRRFQLGLVVPLIAYQSGDRLQGIGLDEAELAPTVLGDIRVSGKARLVGLPGGRGLAVAAGLELALPTGSQEHFAGERGTIMAFHLLGSWRHHWLSAGVDLGVRIRTQEVVFLSPARPHGNELTSAFGVAVNLPVPARYGASALAEYALVVGDSGAGGVRGPSPGEFRLGARLALCTGWSVVAGGGAGLTPDEVGAPAWRMFGGVRYDASPISDIDRDRVEDGRDRCRLQAEDWDGFEDGDGCPDNDNDNDGYPDFADDCPNAPEDYDGHRDVDGCPDEQRPVKPIG